MLDITVKLNNGDTVRFARTPHDFCTQQHGVPFIVGSTTDYFRFGYTEVSGTGLIVIRRELYKAGWLAPMTEYRVAGFKEAVDLAEDWITDALTRISKHATTKHKCDPFWFSRFIAQFAYHPVRNDPFNRAVVTKSSQLGWRDKARLRDGLVSIKQKNATFQHIDDTPEPEKCTNTNVLAGMQCPRCKSNGPFMITITCMAKVHDDGIEDTYEHEWDADSYCWCRDCTYTGVVKHFKAEE